MKIGIDARLIRPEMRGIGKTITNLLNEFKVYQNHTFYVYTDSDSSARLIPRAPHFVIRVIRFPFYASFEQLVLPVVAGFDGLDVLHCPANTKPIMLPRRIRVVVTINDVMYLDPRYLSKRPRSAYQRLGALYRRVVVRLTSRSAARIVTISEHARSEIERRVPAIHQSMIEVIPLACDSHRFFARGKKFQRYLFVIGAADPRKNTARIVRAFVRSKRVSDYTLVVSGLSGPPAGLRGENLRSVRFLGFVSESRLSALYRDARAFLFCSLDEGFGLPGLEAMSSGTPVIASSTTAVGEICAGAALLVDPENETEITIAIERIVEDDSLVESLATAGLKRADQFSWPKTAARFVDAYMEIGDPAK